MENTINTHERKNIYTILLHCSNSKVVLRSCCGIGRFVRKYRIRASTRQEEDYTLINRVTISG